MECPKCAATMEKVRFQEIEVDRCTGCKGLWFDMLEHEELKKLNGSEAIDVGSPQEGRKANGRNDIDCPTCKAPMISMVVNGQSHITYEACTVCYGVYFDAGEFKDFKEQSFVDTIRSAFSRRR